MSQTQTHKPLAEAFSTGASWLSRALAVSLVLHVIAAVVWWRAVRHTETHETETVDIELAPAPPKAEALPAEVARPPESAPEAQQDNAAAAAEQHEEEEALALQDAGVDAPIDAAVDAGVKKKPRPDAGIDAGVDAAAPMIAETISGDARMGGALDGDGGLALEGDGGVALAQVTGGDAGVKLGGDAGLIAAIESGSGAGSGVGLGSGEGSGVPGATQLGSGSGAPGVDNQPAVDGAPTTAGTAANLLAYFPPGHQVTVLVRFDRLRNTEWLELAEQLFKPMPDYQVLFGARTVSIGSKIDSLVISSPHPHDATATTLVVHSKMSRPELRDFIANPDTPTTWTVTKGGMLGIRHGKLFPGDKRVLLAPWQEWIVLAPPTDLPGLLAAARGKIDTIETKAKLPPWLDTIRTIEKESGEEQARGPALVLTLAGPGQRVTFPDLGFGVSSLPSPDRISCAMELVKQGWLIRGNIVFAKERDATEFVKALEKVQQGIQDSHILSGLLRRQHALNIVTGLSIARTGTRVSYATSMSIADGRALMAAAAATLDAYYTSQAQP